LDKLESISGFNVNLSKEDFMNNVNDINIAICSQTANITPADKKLYSLRDVTATVDNLSLIASSIMSKKLAIKSDAIVLDVKVGSGAFMKDLSHAKELARLMVNIGNKFGRKTVAIVTNMDEPLGNAIGNALEVKEAIETLQGNGPKDLYELCMTLGTKLLILAERVDNEAEARKLLEESINSKKAYNKLLEMVEEQGGDVKYIQNPNLLPKTKYVMEIKSKTSGFVRSINAEEIGKCVLSLGAGRETIDSVIDLGAGVILNKKVDDEVQIGETLAFIHTEDLDKGKEVENRILDIYKIGEKNIDGKTLIFDEISN
jgi:pyrimidine-nucleoside phosphorylase